MVDKKIGMTLPRHIYEGQREHPEATGELTGILNQIALAAKIVSREVSKAGLAELLGFTGKENVQGEQVRKLDQFANDVFIAAFNHMGHFCIMVSEEVSDPIEIPEKYAGGQYSICFDPLDGSSNIDANVSVGSIFAIFHKVSPGARGTVEDLLQPGRKVAAAGYVVYGPSTMLVMSTGRGVHGFTLDPSVGEFLESHHGIQLSPKGTIYSANEGNYPYWSDGVRRYVSHVKQHDPATGRPYSSRYVGSMVADVHRTLLYGGLFMYPADTKDPTKPSGKLRLLYECVPMAYLIEQAGGAASTGTRPVLDVQPTEVHQRSPFFGGSRENVEEVERFIAEHDSVSEDGTTGTAADHGGTTAGGADDDHRGEAVTGDIVERRVHDRHS
ncbi:MAG: class 1 fructose-bisphosphatase [Thermoleophilia bacterium]